MRIFCDTVNLVIGSGTFHTRYTPPGYATAVISFQSPPPPAPPPPPRPPVGDKVSAIGPRSPSVAAPLTSVVRRPVAPVDREAARAADDGRARSEPRQRLGARPTGEVSAARQQRILLRHQLRAAEVTHVDGEDSSAASGAKRGQTGSDGAKRES